MFNSIIECVAVWAQKTPSKLCIVDDRRELTYFEYWQEVLQLKQYLKEQGIKKADCIVVEARQAVEYLALELAIQLCGAVFVPMEKNCAAKRIQDVITMTDAVLAITNRAEEFTCNIMTYDQLQDMSKDYLPLLNDVIFPDTGETSEILFSTGTTGKPKGIELSHRNNISLAENVKYGVEMEPDNVELIPVPLNHSHGLRRYYGNMLNGSTVIILNGVLNVQQFFSYIDRYRVTAIDMVPASLAVLLKLSKDKLAEYKKQIKYIQLGAAPLPEEDKETLCTYLPDTRLYNFYGSTESGCVSILDFNKEKGRKYCIGTPTHNVKLMFVDENHNEILATEENLGLLAFYGPMNMKGYWKDSEETQQVLKHGYIFTNDLAYQDNDGYIYLKGRKGDVINVGGSKVSPDEVEEIARRYKGIKDCACVAAPDKMKGFVPRLFIEVEAGVELDIQMVSSFLAEALEPYKNPRQIIIVDKIPRSFNGKLLRKELNNQ